MRKTLVCLSLAVMALFLSTHAAAQSDCTPQFSISPENVSVSSPNLDLVKVNVTVTNTGSCEGSTMVYPVLPEDWLSGDNFTTKSLLPGESDSALIKIIPTTSDAAKVFFIADGAVIAPAAPANATDNGTANATQPAQPPVNVTPTIPIKIETPAPQPTAPIQAPAPAPEQQNTSQPQSQAQPSTVTGMATSNPAVQSAVLVTLLLGGAYVFQNMRNGEKTYRYKR